MTVLATASTSNWRGCPSQIVALFDDQIVPIGIER